MIPILASSIQEASPWRQTLLEFQAAVRSVAGWVAPFGKFVNP